MNAALRLKEIHDRVARACGIARREPEEVTLIAVSKTHPPEVIALGGMTFERAKELGWGRWAAIDGLALKQDC